MAAHPTTVPPPAHPPGPPAGPPPRRVALYVAAAVVVAALAALLAAVLGPDEETAEAPAEVPATSSSVAEDPGTTAPEVPGTSATTTPPPSSSGPEEPTPTTAPEGDAAVQALVDELMAWVEQERGLEFLERPEVVVLDSEAFVERYMQILDEDFEEDAEVIAHYTEIYQALGVLDDDVTIEDAYAAFGAGAVGGFYHTETSELVVRGGDITPLFRVVLAHELVHALDDQHFELYRPEYDDRDDEVGFGFQAVVEGNARWVENRYRATLTAAEEQAAFAEELALGEDLDLSALTFTFIQLQLLPYEAGERLITELRETGGQGAVDQAFVEPPTTSEQVLDPARFLADEDAASVAPPPADGEVVEDGLFGQATLQVLFADAVGNGAAEAAVEGWAGDWFVSWEDAEGTCVRTDVRLDDEDAADDFAGTLARWLDGPPDGDQERLDPTTVRFTVCG